MVNDYTLEVLKQIQQVQLKILLDVTNLCEENDIKYILSNGTLLGAVRHKGFIPWDDDIDIDMKRKDYERFLSIAKKELSPDYFIQNYITDKNCLNSGFTKIRKNGTIHESEGQQHLVRHKGIAIDVFPIDVVPNSKLKRKLHRNSISLIKQLIAIKLKYNYYNENLLKKNIKIIGSILLKPISVFKLGRLMERVMRYYEESDSVLVSNTVNKNEYDSYMFKKDIYKELSYMEFEGFEFTIPEKWNIYLENIYGDYMRLPPENERFNFQHNIINVSLE